MAHTAELIAVGTELLLGSIANTDAQVISRGLSSLGINVFYHTVVGDNPQRLQTAVEIAKTRADIIITTGGLGPTCDDLTKQAVAGAFGLELEFHPEIAQEIKDYFARLHPEKPMTENNLQQAMLPKGCDILQNEWGTAPGCAFHQDGCTVIMLPGPPRECTAMFTHRVLPYLMDQADGAILSRSLRLFGIGESAMEALLRDRMNTMTNPTLAPYAKEGECELRITAKAPTQQEALALIQPVEEELCQLFGDKVYGIDVPGLPDVVLARLKEKKRTLATAESCTGGMIAQRLTDLPGASEVFLGGVVSYTDEVKRAALGVPAETLAQYGAVSPQVAQAMAEGALRKLGADLAVATTGLAGPTGDDRGNPVGLVYVALATAEGCEIQELHLGPTRHRVRLMAALHALDMVRKKLT